MRLVAPTHHGFLSWLKSKDKNTIVGIRCDLCLCPIANYVEETMGPFSALRVRQGSISTIGEEITMPSWGTKFIDRIDHGKDWSFNDPDGRVVYAGEAVRILEEITSE